MRILLIGSDNPWRMEAAVERAMQRAGHTTLLIDDRRMKRLIGWKLTQLWAQWQARRFNADFIFLSKCLALDPETVSAITEGKANAMWYHDPQWHRDLDREDVRHIATIGRIARTFFVTGFENEWRAHGLNARFLPAAGDAGITPVAPQERELHRSRHGHMVGPNYKGAQPSARSRRSGSPTSDPRSAPVWARGLEAPTALAHNSRRVPIP